MHQNTSARVWKKAQNPMTVSIFRWKKRLKVLSKVFKNWSCSKCPQDQQRHRVLIGWVSNDHTSEAAQAVVSFSSSRLIHSRALLIMLVPGRACLSLAGSCIFPSQPEVEQIPAQVRIKTFFSTWSKSDYFPSDCSQMGFCQTLSFIHFPNVWFSFPSNKCKTHL